MSQFSMFMKENKENRDDVYFPVTSSLTDENGDVLNWKIRPLTTKVNESIRDRCIAESAKSTGMHGNFDSSKYISRILCASIIEPNLNDKALQDSYNVMSAEELLFEIVDNPSEYNRLANFVQHFNGFDVSLNEKVQTAKKS